MEKVFTDEMIVESYGDIIEGLLLNGDYVNEKYAISLIREILENGVNPLDLDKIEYICMKFIDIRNLKNNNGEVGYKSFEFSKNKTIIDEAIRLYDSKQDAALDDKDFYDDEIDTICKVHKIHKSR